MNTTCGCCEGTERITPQSTANRPGLPALSYRVGTHATFLETMKARLSGADLPELREALRTREPSDPAIALLDGWATVADVLTFYQERIANEGFLRTATERRSMVELARLIGYAPRPGVASRVYLAYTLDADRSKQPPAGVETLIPAGSQVQSVPGPGELPQTFETSEPLVARTEWNQLQPRRTQPQTLKSILGAPAGPRIFLKGTNTQLNVNDAVLIENGKTRKIFRVVEVLPDTRADRTEVRLVFWVSFDETGTEARRLVEKFQRTDVFKLQAKNPSVRAATKLLAKLETQPPMTPPELERQLLELANAIETIRGRATRAPAPVKAWLVELATDLNESSGRLRAARLTNAAGVPAEVLAASGLDTDKLLKALDQRPSRPPASARRLARDADGIKTAHSDLQPRLLQTFRPDLITLLTPALRHTRVTDEQPIRFHALRVKASLFGHNVPPQPVLLERGKVDTFVQPTLANTWGSLLPISKPIPTVALDGLYEQIMPGAYALIDRPELESHGGLTGKRAFSLHSVVRVQSSTMAAHGLSTKVTQLAIHEEWLANLQVSEIKSAEASTDFLRGTQVYSQSEELELAEEPIEDDVCDGAKEAIELDGWYDGMDSGRWIIITGERTSVDGTSGIPATELAMLAGLEQESDPDLPGDRPHTFVRLANKLAYCYKRDTVTIYGNVVRATHGETKKETLGSGDGAKSLQSFVLRQPPLTFVSAPNPSGIDSTLQVRVNDVQWHEEDSLAGLGPAERKFVTQTSDDGKTKIIFGTGTRGARLPTGVENIRAEYRNGIGKAGNVKAGQITTLVSRPLGAKEVINPLPATGGADKDSRDQARANAPLAVQALDRLVSVRDYEDFARTFAGIGKASAAELTDGARQVVHVTVAGAEDIPIDLASDLIRNLRRALREFGDPLLPVQIDVRYLKLLLINARVRVAADYEWETVEPKVRAALLDAFSFERRDLGQDVTASEVLAVIQKVRGVAWVDLDALEGIEEKEVRKRIAQLLKQKPTELRENPSSTRALLREVSASSCKCLDERVTADLADWDHKPGAKQGSILPAQLAYLSPAVPDTLILSEVTP